MTGEYIRLTDNLARLGLGLLGPEFSFPVRAMVRVDWGTFLLFTDVEKVNIFIKGVYKIGKTWLLFNKNSTTPVHRSCVALQSILNYFNVARLQYMTHGPGWRCFWKIVAMFLVIRYKPFK